MAKKIRDDLCADVVLGVGAHADDLDCNAAGTIARLAAEGAEVYYLILTDGSKGTKDPDITVESLAAMRQQEQRDAAKLLGVKEVFFLGYEDGALEVTLQLKKDIVRFVRRLKPDVMIAFDPTFVYDAQQSFINHSDHRACGQAVLDAAYPLARDHLTFPELAAEGLTPHAVRTLLLTNFVGQHYFVDISDTFKLKLKAIAAHTSQVPDPAEIHARFRQRAEKLGKQTGCEYAEGFVRLDIGICA